MARKGAKGVGGGAHQRSASARLKQGMAVALGALTALTPATAAAQAADGPMRIQQGGQGATAASLVLPIGKAAIIDLPYDARDVLLSNPQIADAVVRTARRVYVIGRSLGQTNAFFFDAQGRQIANVEIRVEPDVAPLNDLFQRHSPDTRVRAEAVNGSLVLTGSVQSAAEAERALQVANRYLGVQPGSNGPQIVNLIQVEGSEQVLVRVRVVEMSRTLVRQLGVNLNAENILNTLLPEDTFVRVATANGYSIAGRLLGGVSGQIGVAESILLPQSVTYPSGIAGEGAPPNSAGVGGYSYDNGGTADPIDDVETFGSASNQVENRIDATIEAFERAGLLRVLSEPNLTAISGESARFLAGGEFPVPVAADDGQISVEFKPFGVGLAFTPIVLSGGRISLKLSTEVSELTSEGAISTGDTPIRNQDGTTSIIRGITIPALQVRRAETTVEMPSGGAIVLAGLIQERTRHAMEGLPGVMNTPVLGTLFRSRDFINNETELVIIVTPYLVRPTSPDRLRTPADGFANPSELQANFMGRLNAVYRGEEHGEGDADLEGPMGHVMP
ncbi:MAG: type II and III secretion system protein family protein [Hydrogenophilaceae bacterium]|jgi:pilus assembly protein CpaC|nr:type II and III secretion system protein family protein [Hydrogenophilaceae bacterium]